METIIVWPHALNGSSMMLNYQLCPGGSTIKSSVRSLPLTRTIQWPVDTSSNVHSVPSATISASSTIAFLSSVFIATHHYLIGGELDGKAVIIFPSEFETTTRAQKE